jgi:hypothetical protein
MLLWLLSGKRKENNDKQLNLKVWPRYNSIETGQTCCYENGLVVQQ